MRQTIDTITSVTSRTITYTADEFGTYYVVIDNTEDPVDGADTGKTVGVHMVIDSIL